MYSGFANIINKFFMLCHLGLYLLLLQQHLPSALSVEEPKFRCQLQSGCDNLPCGVELKAPAFDDHHLECKPSDARVLSNTMPTLGSTGYGHGFKCRPISGCTFAGCKLKPEFDIIPGFDPVMYLEMTKYFITCSAGSPAGGWTVYRCKPRTGCDFSNCDPLPQHLLYMDGVTQDTYRETEAYHIKCLPMVRKSAGSNSKGQGDSSCGSESMMSELAKNMTETTKLIIQNQAHIYRVRSETFRRIEDLSRTSSSDLEKKSLNMLEKMEMKLDLLSRNIFDRLVKLESKFAEMEAKLDGSPMVEVEPPVSLCHNVDCGGHGICFEGRGCVCSPGYISERSSCVLKESDSAAPGRCSAVDCGRNGVCYEDQGCVCYSGYIEIGESCMPEGFCKVKYDGVCYWVLRSEQTQDYRSSLAICTSTGGTSADIVDRNLYNILLKHIQTDIMPAGDNRDVYWTGMTYDKQDRSVLLSTGEVSSFRKWIPGDPARNATRTRIALDVNQLRQGMKNYHPSSLLNGIICKIGA